MGTLIKKHERLEIHPPSYNTYCKPWISLNLIHQTKSESNIYIKEFDIASDMYFFHYFVQKCSQFLINW